MKRAENNGPERRQNDGWKIAAGLFLAGALSCIVAFWTEKSDQSKAGEEYKKLEEQTSVALSAEPEEASAEPGTGEPSGEPEPGTSGEAGLSGEPEEQNVPVPEKTVDFGELQGTVNADIYAWIYIPDTEIDYPVLQHPTDNSYYLNYNLDGSRGYPGCIYTEDYNQKDFSDPDTVLYGHNMKNGTMFAGLHKYEDSGYLESHPYIYIYTEVGLLVYEIFAAYQSGDEHILYAHEGFQDREVFEEYIEEILNIPGADGVLKTDTAVTADSRILTLSTCVSGKPDKRFLVQGVLVDMEAVGMPSGE